MKLFPGDDWRNDPENLLYYINALEDDLRLADAEQTHLKELLTDLADDAGYNLDAPPAHWCTKGKCSTCRIWEALKPFKYGDSSEVL